MNLATARRLVAACVLPVAATAALAGPSVASAAFKPAALLHCEGESIEGQGSSLQKFSQQTVWNPDFNTFVEGCNGGGAPTVKYNSTGSGPGLESWGVETASAPNFTHTNAFVGTDNGPTEAQSAEIEAEGTSTEGKVQTIPVEQAAVAIVVHLPTGCTAKAGKKTGKKARLALSSAQVEKILEGNVTWTALNGVTDFDKLKCKGKTAKAAEGQKIKRVVRLEGSGTTSIIMKYNALSEPSGTVDEGVSWNTEAQKADNIVWPNENTGDPVVRGKGNGGMASTIAATPGTVGYVNLADVRANGSFTPAPGTGGEGTSEFWVEVENGPGTYADPSTDKDSATKALSNCSETNYTNGSKHFPPTSTEKAWNEVTTATTEPNYPICGLTFDLALSKYNQYPGASEKEARTVFDYVKYMLSTGPGGGQTKINENSDYEGLPALIEGIAQEGLEEKVSFE